MRTRLIAVLASIALLTGAAVAPPARSAPAGAEQQARPQAAQSSPERANLDELAARFERMGRPLWVPGEVVVEFRPGVGPGRAREVIRGRGLRPDRRMPLSGLHVARVPRGRPVARAAAELRSHPAVRDAEPNLLRYPASQSVPNDPLFDQQWGLLNIGQEHGTSNPELGPVFEGTLGADIKATEAWDFQQGSEDVVIAVADTGVQLDHPDIAGNLWVNQEMPNGQDDDMNGYVDDIHGCDFTMPAQPPADRCQSLFDGTDTDVEGFDHGTHVAGTIAAVTDNAEGVAGVCPSCKIMVLKIGRPFGPDEDRFMGITLEAQVEALDYARLNGADIVNASFGIPVLWSGIERRAYQRLQRAGVLAVVAAGNARGDNDRLLILSYTDDEEPDALSPIYPASYDLPGIISVAASNSRDEYGFVSNCPATEAQRWRCAFTNWGNRSVHLAAPGVDIVSTVPAGTGRNLAFPDYDFFDGTSMAAPHVAGVAGLVKAENPSWGRGQIKRAILNSVEMPPGLRTLTAFPGPPFLPATTATGRFIRTNGRLDARQAVARDHPGPGVGTGRHDNIARARWIPDTRRGRLRWPGNSNHVYKKRLVRGARYRVRLQGPPGEDFNLFVWRPFTQDIWQIEEGCIGLPGPCALFRERDVPGRSFARVTFRAPASRVFYIHVNTFLFSGGRYTLRAWRCTRPAPRC